MVRLQRESVDKEGEEVKSWISTRRRRKRRQNTSITTFQKILITMLCWYFQMFWFLLSKPHVASKTAWEEKRNQLCCGWDALTRIPIPEFSRLNRPILSLYIPLHLVTCWIIGHEEDFKWCCWWMLQYFLWICVVLNEREFTFISFPGVWSILSFQDTFQQSSNPFFENLPRYPAKKQTLNTSRRVIFSKKQYLITNVDVFGKTKFPYTFIINHCIEWESNGVTDYLLLLRLSEVFDSSASNYHSFITISLVLNENKE